ncbi:MAG TPA: alpha-ketoacid dehydrogenase subunit beta [Steroidobacteraceae bacterium]|nr:alpha-ketoacid dehydrogenase subunit beta [Steroidobacteraceae bacterium]
MAKKSYRQAINEALRLEMQRDHRVIVCGEDVSGGQAGSAGLTDCAGGVFGVTKGLITQFGVERVIDTPITESAFIGMAVGAANTGLRPVVELMFVDFMGVCFDQIFNQAAKLRYMFGGKAKTPLVIRAMAGAGVSAAAQHSQMLDCLFTHIPGLKVVMPSGPYDAKGLLIQAIRDDDPVIFLEHKMLYDVEEEVPDGAYSIPFGEANYLAEGKDVTLVATSRMARLSLSVAQKLARDRISVEVVDPRTASPLDSETILESFEKTGRLVIVDESPPRCSLATDIAALIASKGFRAQKAPVQMVTAAHTPVPFSPTLEKLYLPDEGRIEHAVRAVLN